MKSRSGAFGSVAAVVREAFARASNAVLPMRSEDNHIFGSRYFIYKIKVAYFKCVTKLELARGLCSF